MAQHFNIIIFVMHLIALWHSYVCEINVGTNIHEILESHLMPLDLFTLCAKCRLRNKISNEFTAVLHLMTYHRKMIHNYMTSNYLSKEILNSMNIKENELIKSGIKGDTYFEGNQSNAKSSDVFNKMLVESGSLQYKSLLKSLMAIYYRDTNSKEISQYTYGSGNRYRRSSDPNQPSSAATEEYDYGDITGYAYTGAPSLAPRSHFISPGEFNNKLIFKDNFALISKKNNKNGYDHPQKEYTSDYEEHSERLNSVTDLSKNKKEINFKDISDIALTTLAFLSFGMFTLQVLMCIVMSKEDEQSIMMLPMEVTEPSETIDGTEEIRRRKRSVNKNKTFKQIIDMSRLMLISVENVASTGQTAIFNGRNLPCNIYTARELSFQQKAWILLIILMAIYYRDTNSKEISQYTYGSGNRYRRSSDPNQPSSAATEEYDYGDITGYAYTGAPSLAPRSHFISPGEFNNKLIFKDNFALISKKNNKNGYDHPQKEYTSDYEEHSERLNSVTDLSKNKKEINFKDISDIALTTLAFLSFGMFTLQVLMCIVMSKEDEQSIMMLPMEVTEPSETIDGTEEIRRRKRSVNKNKTFKQIIDMSRLMLISVENVASTGQTAIFNGRNLPCNIYTARELSFQQKAWILLIMLQKGFLR
ncbi:uncharacterized protein Dsimw501_GD28448, isoform B [Drosophila simulans]|uniref:Uncharacterized protein, isoform B n=1 Tax=Drosophila simulans TaxID=7240 RepID=A0A0J9S1P8_DROSI|nr:uncharacterized protein Dsimw501_GD28448, isoform B [Drosophila simulans]